MATEWTFTMQERQQQQEEAEWDALVNEFAETWTKGGRAREVACTPHFTNRPHPESYRPDLPLSGSAGLWATNARERKVLATRPVTVLAPAGSATEVAGDLYRGKRETYVNTCLTENVAREIDKRRDAILRARARVRAIASQLSLILPEGY